MRMRRVIGIALLPALIAVIAVAIMLSWPGDESSAGPAHPSALMVTKTVDRGAVLYAGDVRYRVRVSRVQVAERHVRRR